MAPREARRPVHLGQAPSAAQVRTRWWHSPTVGGSAAYRLRRVPQAGRTSSVGVVRERLARIGHDVRGRHLPTRVRWGQCGAAISPTRQMRRRSAIACSTSQQRGEKLHWPRRLRPGSRQLAPDARLGRDRRSFPAGHGRRRTHGKRPPVCAAHFVGLHRNRLSPSPSGCHHLNRSGSWHGLRCSCRTVTFALWLQLAKRRRRPYGQPSLPAGDAWHLTPPVTKREPSSV